ncbi:MAG: winged helix-turn-helix transcriptional regulator [Alphaproteobacteria bacterium]|nr:winged helix-turn-helix transcriptional regulator [Alphaproteobacteria bacterium]
MADIASNIDRPAPPLGTELDERPGYLVRRLHQIHVALFLEECGTDVTPVQYGVLTVLYRHPGMDQASIGAEVGIDRTNAADVLARLEARGLVRRAVGATDRRVKHAFLTPKGIALTLAMEPAMQRAQDRLLAPLPPETRAVFLAHLDRLVTANNAFSRAPARTGWHDDDRSRVDPDPVAR